MKLMLGCAIALSVVATAYAATFQEVYNKGMEEFRARKFEEAEATLAEAVKLAKTAVEIRDAFSNYLRSMYQQKKYKEIVDIAKSTFADEESTGGQKLFAANYAIQSCKNLRRFPEMEEWADKLMELNDPGSFWYNYGVASKGKALRRQNKPAEALELLTEDAVFIMHPQHQDKAILERAHSRRAVRQFSEAADDYIRSFELPGGAPWRKDIAVGYAIECLTESDRMDEAAPWVARIDNVGSKFWRCFAHMRAAQLLQKQGKLAEAKAQYEAAIKDNDYWWKNSSEQQISAIDEQLSE